MQTRAAVAHKAGEPLSIETVELDGPKAGECLVEIKATGSLPHRRIHPLGRGPGRAVSRDSGP